MLSLVLAVVLESQRPLVVKFVQPLEEIAIATGNDTEAIGYAHDDQFEYLGTPAGLYRRAIGGSSFARVAFADETIHAIAIRNGALYVLKGVGSSQTSPDHTLVRSFDRGVTFTAIDQGLLDCASGECRYLVPKRIAFGPQHLFVNAGGNLLVTADDGATWHLLHGLPHDGKPTSQVCDVEFGMASGRMLLGGECPLDIAWLSAGMLRSDLLDWLVEPQPVIAPDLENRNVQFIRDVGNGVVYAGIEGALLRSSDGGASFGFVIHHTLDDERLYPYIGHLVVSSRDPRLIIVGGFDKKHDVGYLTYSSDGGATWRDVSQLVGDADVAMLAEDASGRVIAALQYRDRFVLAELVIGEKGKRRAVR